MAKESSSLSLIKGLCHNQRENWPIISESCSWRRGSLRPFESFGSIGAKYIWLNKVSVKSFANVIFELTPENKYSTHTTIDVEGFQSDLFLKLIDEPRALAKKLSAKLLLPPSFWEAANISNGLDYSKLRICPQCIRIGYHSFWHQIPWLDVCVFHGERLTISLFKPRGSNRYPSADLALIDPLHKLWFEPGSTVWAEAFSSAWSGKGAEDIQLSRAKNFLDKAKAVGICLNKHNVSEPFVRNADPQTAVRLAFMACDVTVPSQLKAKDQKFSTYNFLARDGRAKQIRSIAKIDIDSLCLARRLGCEILGLLPEWRRVQLSWLDQIDTGHSQCRELFERAKSYDIGFGGGALVMPSRYESFRDITFAMPCPYLALSYRYHSLFLNYWVSSRRFEFSRIPAELLANCKGKPHVEYWEEVDFQGKYIQREEVEIRYPIGLLGAFCDALLLEHIWRGIDFAVNNSAALFMRDLTYTKLHGFQEQWSSAAKRCFEPTYMTTSVPNGFLLTILCPSERKGMIDPPGEEHSIQVEKENSELVAIIKEWHAERARYLHDELEKLPTYLRGGSGAVDK